MIKKRKLPNQKYSVTFTLRTLNDVDELYLLGEFNGWNPAANPMTKAPDGSWSAKLTLEGEKEYQYRYCDNNGVWYNDDEPDAYVRNEYGADNCLVSLVNGVTRKAPTKKILERKKKAL